MKWSILLDIPAKNMEEFNAKNLDDDIYSFMSKDIIEIVRISDPEEVKK